MKKIEEIKEWLLENAVDEDGDLNLCDLDFSDFNGDVYIERMKVKYNLHQGLQKVQGTLFQNGQKVKCGLCQNYQEVKGDFVTQTLEENECYEIDECNDTYIVRAIKKHTLEELKEIVGYDFEIVEKEEKENE